MDHPMPHLHGPVLVTGGAGFIGSAVVAELLRLGCERVVVLDAFTYAGGRDSLPTDGRLTVIEGDIADPGTVRAAIGQHPPRAILHLAAESHVDRSIDGPMAFVRTNVVGTATLLEAARAFWSSLDAPEREAFRFVHVSTDEVFGSLEDDGVFGTSTPYDPRSPYSATKAGSDHLARAWWHTFGMPVVVTNCSNNYGPRQHPEKLIPHMVLRGLAGLELPVYGSGANVRDWLHVEDHARGLVAAALRGEPGATYLFGGSSERSNLDVVRELCAILDDRVPEHAPHERLVTFVTDRPGHDFRYAVDPSSARDGLGWSPARSFEEGLAATVDWYLSHRPWWTPRVETGRLARLGLVAGGGRA